MEDARVDFKSSQATVYASGDELCADDSELLSAALETGGYSGWVRKVGKRAD